MSRMTQTQSNPSLARIDRKIDLLTSPHPGIELGATSDQQSSDVVRDLRLDNTMTSVPSFLGLMALVDDPVDRYGDGVASFIALR